MAGFALFPTGKNNLVWAVLAGSALGAAAVLILSILMGLNGWAVALAGILAVIFFAFTHRRIPVRVSLEKPALVLLLLAAVFFSLVAVSVFRIEDVPRGVRIDFGFHQSIVTSMANGNVPPQHPLLSGEPLRYYFLPHLVSAALMAGGLDVQWATWIPFVVWNAALCVGIFLLARRLLGSSAVAALAVVLFLFNGSFAWIPYLQTHDVIGQWDAFVQNPGFLSDYRQAGFPFENNLVAQNVFTRSFPLGFGLLLLLVFGLLEKWDLKKMGVLAGLLPLIHLPSFGLWALFAAAYALAFDRRKEWWMHGAVAGVLAVPALALLLGAPVASTMQPHWGWMAPDASPFGWLVFWLGNIGLYAMLAAWAAWQKPKSELTKMTVAAFPAFVIGNAVLLAPNPWDNIKLFVLFFLLLAMGAADALAKLWKDGVALKTVALGLVALMTLTGVLHAASVWAHRGDVMYPANDWAACRWLDGNVPKDAVLLTDGTHTCASVLAGRRVVVGPDEWLDNHGLDYRQQLQDNNAMLAGDCALLERYDVSYFYDGGYLGRGAPINRTFWNSQEKTYDQQGVTIYTAACEPDRP